MQTNRSSLTATTGQSSYSKFLSTLALLLMLMLSGLSFGQTNPTAFNLSGGNFSFTTQTISSASYPTNIQGWDNAANPATLFTVASTTNVALTASAGVTTAGIGNLGPSGFQFLGTNAVTNVGAIVVAVNATNRANIKATWTAVDQTNLSGRQTNLTLQYRLGTSGAFTTVTGGTYTTNTGGTTGIKAAQIFTDIALPSACNNQPVVQLRWIYYESASQSGSRDAIRLDDITVASSPAAAVDGVISANEYGVHTNGSNQQSSASGTWYMNWDATNLYVGVTGGTATEGAIMYLDKNPLALVNGGTNADGNLVGQGYDGSGFANLQFRADLVVYFKSGYDEFRTADGSGGWSAPDTSATSAAAGTTREISIPWSAIGGMPTAFNWFGYVAYTGGGAYESVPIENPGSAAGTIIGSSARWDRYYTVSNTSSTLPFSRNSYTFTSALDVSSFGSISAYDFTMNSAGRFISRSGNVTGNWTIGGNLNIGAGTIYMGSGGSGYGTTSVAGNLNLLGGTYDMDATTAPTLVTGNVSIASGATLKLSTQVGGDFNIVGNWSNLGTFTPSSRAVNFNGSAAQTLTGATTFDYFALNNALGLTLFNNATVNQSLDLTLGKITLGTNSLTASGTLNASGTNYIVTNSTGQLKRTVGAGNVIFPVGNSAYNPIILNNTGGTSDTYGINVLDGTYATPFDNTKVVNRRWQVSEAVASGSNLSVVGQYNTADTFGANFTAGSIPLIGFYNGTSWTTVGANAAGANPFTYTSTASITPSNLTTGTQYIGLGKDNAFISSATKLVITAISPSTPSAGGLFNVTVQAQDIYNLPANVVAGTTFSLTTNGNAGAIGGTLTGTIVTGTNSIVISGVTLTTAGTLVTVTATRTSGDTVTAGTSNTFTVLGAPTQLAFVNVPSTGNVGVNLTTFTVEARRPDLSVDNTYTGNVTIAKASGTGTLTGTLTIAAVAGVATFSSVQFDAADTYTLNANSGSLTQATSGNIVVTLAPVVLAGWDFFGQSSPITFAATTFNSNLVSTSSLNLITRGGGAASSTGGNSFRTVGFQNDGISTVNTDYFQTTLKTVPGQSLSLSAITGNVVGTSTYSASPGVSMQFAYSLDGTTFTLIGSPVVVSGTTPATMPSISTTGVAVLQNISPETTVYIRYYATGQTSTGGWGFSSATSGTNGLAFSGNILCTQPTAYAVTGGGAYCTGGSGVAVGLANSQLGINYQLKDGATNVGSPVAGTGAAISFGSQTAAGTYTVVATNTNGTCNLTTAMTGNAIVSLNPLPAGTLTNGGAICAGTQPQLTFTSSAGTGPFSLVINGQTYNNIASGVPFAATGTAPTVDTTYTLSSITGQYCNNPSPSASSTVTVNPLVSAGTVSGAASVFLGNTTAFSTDGTLNGTWSSANAAIASVEATTGIVTGNALGTTQITYTVNSGCGSPVSSSATITVTDVTTWTGISGAGSWNHGTPTIFIKAAIEGSYDTSVDGNFSAFSLVVDPTGSLVITENNVVTLENQLINNGSVTIESDGNLIQVTNSSANSGEITVKRIIAVKDNKQYNYLISPTIGTNLKTNIYGTGKSAPFTLSYNETNDTFSNSNGAYIKGRGLAVKEPASGGATAIFKGVPMNEAFSFALANTNVAMETTLGYNMTGNPYPSNIDLDKLYNLGTNSSNISPTFYFWDNTVNTVAAQDGTGYSGAAYAVFNAEAGSAGTGLAAGSLSGNVNGTKVPTRIVKTGQGFIVQSIEKVNKTLEFDNTIRTAEPNPVFFGKGENVQDDRFWLRLSAPTNVTTQLAIVYFKGGDDAFAKDDSKLNGLPSDVLYSVIGDQKVVINGRAPFVNTDQIPLGTNSFLAGTYIFSLGDQEGVFANGQNIYLKDKVTGIITNLNQGSYSFTTTAGEQTGRFEILYQPEIVLVTDFTTKSGVEVYRDANDFVVRSSQKELKQIEVYDASGRLIYTVRSNSKQVRIDSEPMANGIYILKARFKDDSMVSVKVRK